jgi:LacI family transcriptional regulator
MGDGDWSPSRGYEVAREMLAWQRRPTAIFVGNDHMALGALRALHEAGVKVPHEMSMIGFDDIVGADQMIPPLTTIRQDMVEVGRAAVKLLVSRIGGEEPVHRRIHPALIRRESTAPPAHA